MEPNELNKKFEEIYKSSIELKLNGFESRRLELKQKRDLIMKIGIALCSFCIIAGIFEIVVGKNIIGTALAVVTFFVLMISAALISNYFSNSYRKMVKPTLLKPILSVFGNFRLEDKEVLSLKEIKSLGLYCNAQSKKDDDIIVGTYEDIPITIIETKLTRMVKNNNDNSSSKVDCFSGLILKIKMNKSFEGITVGEQKENIDNYTKLLKEVSQKNPELCHPQVLKILDNSLFNTISQAQRFMNDNKLLIRNGKLYVDIFDRYTKNKVTRTLEKISLEDSEFNSNYNIYSDNQVESRYLLTTAFMERLKNIQSTFLVLSVDFVFNGGYLYLFLDKSIGSFDIAVAQDSDNGHGFFEVGNINRTLLDKTIYLKLFRELASIFSLINYFKLNEKTGL